MIPIIDVPVRLRLSREQAGYRERQAEFAEVLGVSRNTVANYELGKTDRRRPIVMRAWALATGVPLEWIEDGVVPEGYDPVAAGSGLLQLDSNQQPAD